MSENCPGCGGLLDGGMCSGCGQQSFSTVLVPSLSRSVRRLSPMAECSLAMTLDRSGSHRNWRAGTRVICEVVLKGVERVVRELRVTVQTHSDVDFGEEPIVVLEEGSVDEALSEIERIKYAGGKDPAESHAESIERMHQMVSWPKSRRDGIGVLMAVVNADSKPSRSGRSPREIGEMIKASNVAFFLVGERFDFALEMVEGAGGMFLEISNEPNREEFEAVAGRLCASISSSIATGQISQDMDQ